MSVQNETGLSARGSRASVNISSPPTAIRCHKAGAMQKHFLTLGIVFVVVTKASAVILFSEDFESLPLGPYVSPTEIPAGNGTDWTDVAPPGWDRDQGTTLVG